MKRRGELRLIEHAVNQDWDVPEEQRDRSLSLIHEVLTDPRATERERLRAARVGIAMGAANIRALTGKSQQDVLLPYVAFIVSWSPPVESFCCTRGENGTTIGCWVT